MGKFHLAFVALFAFLSAHAQNAYPWPSSGNVGVGTFAPVSLLHVNEQLTARNAAGGYHLIVNDVNTYR